MITFDLARMMYQDDIGSPDFNSVYRLTSDGVDGYVTDMRPDGSPWGFAPDMVEYGRDDISIDEPWQALTGNSGQQGYTGPVMHPSEQWSRCHVDDLIRIADDDTVAYLLFSVVVVLDGNDMDGEPSGWAVVYRTVEP